MCAFLPFPFPFSAFVAHLLQSTSLQEPKLNKLPICHASLVVCSPHRHLAYLLSQKEKERETERAKRGRGRGRGERKAGKPGEGREEGERRSKMRKGKGGRERGRGWGKRERERERRRESQTQWGGRGDDVASPICSLARGPDGAVMESNRTSDN